MPEVLPGKRGRLWTLSTSATIPHYNSLHATAKLEFGKVSRAELHTNDAASPLDTGKEAEMSDRDDDGAHPLDSNSSDTKPKPHRPDQTNAEIDPSDLPSKDTSFYAVPKIRIAPLSSEQRREVLSGLFYEGSQRIPYYRRFYFMLTMSAIIATIGLGIGSPAVVIGAMLIAPLMTPLLAGAAALALGWPMRQLHVAAFLAIATAFVIAIAFLVPWLFQLPRELRLPEEILSRTHPAFGDLLVALCAGAAGAYVLIRKEAISALPGVAMAVALVPPLCAVGILVYVGEYSLASQAFLLYLTNFAAIVLSASIVFILMGCRPQFSDRRSTLRVVAGSVLACIFVVLIAIPLVSQTAARFTQMQERHQTILAVTDWRGANDVELIDIELIDVRFSDDRAVIYLAIVIPLGDLTGGDVPSPLVLLHRIGLTEAALKQRVADRLGRQLELELVFELRYVT